MTGRRRDERGAALIVVLGVTTFIVIIVGSLLGLMTTSARLTSVATSDRGDLYAATSAVDAAIQTGRTAEWIGRYGTTCPTMTVPTGGTAATVTCTSTTGQNDVDRTVTYSASVGGQVRAVATVVYRYATQTGGLPSVEVTSWRSS